MKKKQNQKQIEEIVLTDNEEPTIDGKKLSEVFDIKFAVPVKGDGQVVVIVN